MGKNKQIRPRLTPEEFHLVESFRKSKEQKQRRFMILPDLHAPFIRKDAFDWARRYAEKYEITDFACTGDVVDFHKSSFHTSEIDALNADVELEEAIKQLKPWHDAFPNMKISAGNHDCIPLRKLKESSLSSRIMRPFNEIMEVPTWDFDIKHDIGHNTEIHHGEKRAAHTMAKEEGKNIIMGHKHSKTFIWQYYIKLYGTVWAMQLGALFDQNSYAARYNAGGASSIPSVGFLFENDDYWIPFFKILD